MHNETLTKLRDTYPDTITILENPHKKHRFEIIGRIHSFKRHITPDADDTKPDISLTAVRIHVESLTLERISQSSLPSIIVRSSHQRTLILRGLLLFLLLLAFFLLSYRSPLVRLRFQPAITVKSISASLEAEKIASISPK